MEDFRNNANTSEQIMKHLIAAFILASASLMGQTTEIVTVGPSASVRIPKHLIYQHFLAMVSDLDNKATAAGATDPYQFAQPFARARFENADLDLMRTEARALIADLKNVDQKAKLFIDDYRARAKAAASQGQPVPPLPPDLRRLEKERTAVSINHMMTLRTSLGPATTAHLEAYFAREIAPHLSLRALGHAPVDPNALTLAPTAGFAIQP
jgi:hypothetical protein